MYYIGVDLSLRSTGITVIDDENNIFYSGHYGISLKRNSTEQKKVWRLEMITKFISSAISKVYDDTDIKPYLIIERPAYAARGYQNSLSELHGAVKLQMALRFKLYPVVLTSTHARKVALGKGSYRGKNAKKEIMRDVENKYGIAFKNNDQADAFVVAKAFQMDLQKIKDL